VRGPDRLGAPDVAPAAGPRQVHLHHGADGQVGDLLPGVVVRVVDDVVRLVARMCTNGGAFVIVCSEMTVKVS